MLKTMKTKRGRKAAAELKHDREGPACGSGDGESAKRTEAPDVLALRRTKAGRACVASVDQRNPYFPYYAGTRADNIAQEGGDEKAHARKIPRVGRVGHGQAEHVALRLIYAQCSTPELCFVRHRTSHCRGIGSPSTRKSRRGSGSP